MNWRRWVVLLAWPVLVSATAAAVLLSLELTYGAQRLVLIGTLAVAGAAWAASRSARR